MVSVSLALLLPGVVSETLPPPVVAVLASGPEALSASVQTAV